MKLIRLMKWSEFDSQKWLYKSVDHYVVHKDIIESYMICWFDFSYVVMMNVDVLCTDMKFWVLVNDMIFWLFIWIIIKSNLLSSSSFSNFCIQTAFFVVSVRIMYLILQKNKMTIFWHFKLQKTDSLISWNMYSDVDFLNQCFHLSQSSSISAI
jgi:hypothetical protein